MLMPKRTKYRKQQKGRIRGNASRGTRVDFGDFAIKALEPGRVTSRQIEAARIAITRKMKRIGNVYIRVFPDKPVTNKPAEVRMGKGKGAIDHWAASIHPGRIIFEIGGSVPEELARASLQLGQQKLPLKTKIVVRPDYVAE